MKRFSIACVLSLIICGTARSQEFIVDGICALPGQAWSVWVADGFAYVACDSLGLQVVDVSDPSVPELVASYDTPGMSFDLIVAGQYVYIADYSSMQIIDISDPLHPAPVGSYAISNLIDIQVDGDIAYLACGYHPPVISIVDVSSPANPDSVGGISFLGGAFAVFHSGDYLYALSNVTEPYSNYLRLIDVSDVGNPFVYRSLGIPGDVEIPGDVKVVGSYAYIADRSYGLQIADISDPANPAIIGSCDTPGDAWALFMQNDCALIADYYGGIQAIDAGDPRNPIFAARGQTDDPATGVFFSNDRIFAVAGSSLVIFWTELISTYGNENSKTGFALQGNYPNPFNSSTTIEYSLPEAGEVSFEIFDLLGRKVETLVEGKQDAGTYRVTWNAENQSSGVYFYMIKAGDYLQTRRMVLLK